MKQREIIVDMGKAAFVVLAFKVVATTSWLIPWNALADNLCIVFALCVVLVKLCTLTLPLSRLLTLAAAALFALYTCVSMGQYDLLVTVIAVCLLIDEDLLSLPYFGCHPCINTSSLLMKTADVLEILIPAMGHEPRTVVLHPEEP